MEKGILKRKEGRGGRRKSKVRLEILAEMVFLVFRFFFNL